MHIMSTKISRLVKSFPQNILRPNKVLSNWSHWWHKILDLYLVTFHDSYTHKKTFACATKNTDEKDNNKKIKENYKEFCIKSKRIKFWLMSSSKIAQKVRDFFLSVCIFTQFVQTNMDCISQSMQVSSKTRSYKTSSCIDKLKPPPQYKYVITT